MYMTQIMNEIPLEEILIGAAYLAAIAFGGVICGGIFVRIFSVWAKNSFIARIKNFSVDRLRGPILLLFPVGFYFIATYFYRPEALKTAPFLGAVRVIMFFAI
jgi:hypothetical protein